MKARIRWGLIAGAFGLVVNTMASLIFALCGPVLSFAIGIVTGWIVAGQEPARSKGEGAQNGAISGLIAGALILLGQIIGSVGNLAFAQMVEYESIFGPLPDLSSPEGQAIYWLVGVGVGVCFGLVDTLACVFGGALVGYIRTPEATSVLEEKDNAGSD